MSDLIRRTRLIAFVSLLLSAALVDANLTPALADIVGIVRGTLTGQNSRPLAHVTVTLIGERTSLTAVTDAEGRFAFPRVSFGRYTVAASTPEGTATASVDVATDAVADVALVVTAVIGRTTATAHGVRGTPTSENAYGERQLAALPRNNRLDAIVETVPGVVRFSYDEPVAHGFHGISYELDGAPLPQSASANFAQLVDPRNVSSVEIFTGAFPAEFGGGRMGAVVNVVTGLTGPDAGTGGLLGFGGGNLATVEGRFAEHFALGAARLGLAFNTDRTSRGLDTPGEDAVNDSASTGNGFLRLTTPMGAGNQLAASVSFQHAAFQVPINLNPNDPTSPIVSMSGTNDVQLEDTRFVSLSFTHTSLDGNGFVQIVPWARYDRVRYLGDLPNDVLAYRINDDGSTTQQNGLRQDRAGTFAGVRASAFRAGSRHAVKLGGEVSVENFRSAVTVACAPGNCLSDTFTDNATARGTQSGFYVEDKWTPNTRLAVNAGLRYDHSTGYVSGAQLSPRIGVNQEIGHGTILHGYYGRMYAAPTLEDTRRDAVLTQTSPDQQPVYDLKPERDTYVELGIARPFAPGVRAYLNAFDRTAVNVLDTTNLLNTPLFVVFNNSIARDRGIEFRFERERRSTGAGVSLTYSRAEAGGVSGSTFLLAGAPNDITLQPEDHDQTWVGNAYLTRHFGAELRSFATLQLEYGTGFPIAFQNGNGRLPAHSIVNASIGRTADTAKSGLGFTLAIENLLDHRYPIKVNNGFNTTQWNAPRRVILRVTGPL